jgi:hypothetical protein
MNCGSLAVDCHEICRGPARERCLREPRLWLALCRPCHDAMDDYSQWPLARQIACRILWELGQTVWVCNEVRGRPQTALTVDEILVFLAPSDAE